MSAGEAAAPRGAATPADVAAELPELADLLAGLPDSAWDAPSLCAGWRVREVVAHMTLPMHASTAAVVVGLVRARFRFDVLADRRARLDGRRTPAELVAALRAPRMLAWTPPGGGVGGALVHAVVHGLDITRALELDRRPPPARLLLALDGLTSPRSLAALGADVAGVRLTATDLDWSYGEGRVVSAPAEDLVLILAGRRLVTRPSADPAVRAANAPDPRTGP
jgi:uncharacterized protein (TIGR03083 family)